jgi:pimeloyl-ACP methyl ester carboxylesterase
VIGPRRTSEQASPVHSALIEGARRRRAEFPSRAAAREAYRGRGAFASWPDDVLADYVEAGFRDLPDGSVRLACEPAWEASTFLAQGSDPWAALDLAPCPVEILKAERNSTCRVDEANAAPGRITVETVAGTSHFLPMERPALATERLRRALAEP